MNAMLNEQVRIKHDQLLRDAEQRRLASLVVKPAPNVAAWVALALWTLLHR